MNLKVDIPEHITEPITKPLKHLTDKPAASLGKGLSDIFDLVFGPFEYLKEKQQIKYAKKLEKYKQELAEKEQSIPEEKLKEPELHVVSLALENSKYCITNDDLRHMFVNLIAGTMDKSKITHPSFSEIIKQMNSVDANVLLQFKIIDDALPLLELRKRTLKSLEEDQHQIMFQHIFTLNGNKSPEKLLKKIEENSIALTNLKRLGLINIDYSKYFVDDIIYADLLELADYVYESKSIKPDEKWNAKGIAYLTTFGKSFIDVCLSD